MRQRRPIEIFNLSFLDVISCGFCAIILLLVIFKISTPTWLEKQSATFAAQIAILENDLRDLEERKQLLRQALELSHQQQAEQQRRLARAHDELVTAGDAYQAAKLENEAQERIGAELESAQQTLSEDLRRLLGADYRLAASDALIGGIPVDSEYVIFIIDTSGSMHQHAWPLVLRKIGEILAIYPKIQGIQVINDMGDYLFRQYQGKWIPDSQARRKAIIKRLANWAPFSNSSPVEGIEAAIKRFYAPDKRISLYVFGDDFSNGSMQHIIDAVRQWNRADSSGKHRVRIHAVGFPVQFKPGGLPINAVRFAALMRKLAENNSGSFVGLPTLQR